MEFGDINSVGSVRLKVFEPCNWSCEFCHNEGDLLASPISWDGDIEDKLNRLRESCGIQEVHLTGGEPTLNPQTPSIISGLKKSGFVAKITTNGQFLPRIRDEIVESGVDAVNFSLHSLDPVDLAKVMFRKVDKAWAQRQIERSTDNIIFLRNKGVAVRINAVLSNEADIKRIIEVFRFAAVNQVEMRLLDNLDRKEEAARAIKKLIKDNAGEQIGFKREMGTSSSRTTYHFPEIGNMVVKQIEKMFLRGVCESCPHFGKESCKEGFYNIRMQKRNGEWIIILCIQNKNGETVLSLDDFLTKYRQ